MLTERIEEDRIEIVGPFRQLQVRVATIIERDGVEITRAFHRKALSPDADVAGESDMVRGVAGLVWTEAVRDAWGLERARQRAAADPAPAKPAAAEPVS